MQATRIQEPHTRPWTREEYERAAPLGLLGQDEKLDLLEGEIIQKVSPQRFLHAWTVAKAAEILGGAFGRR